MNPHSHTLRTGRFSETGRIYLLTTATHQRIALFLDFRIARRVIQELRKTEALGRCRTLAYVLMPDHLHWLIELGDSDLSALICRFKASAAAAVNRELATPGTPRWQDGFHDHAIRRDEDLVALARYVVANPLRAGIVSRVGDYPHWDAVWL